MIARDLPNTPYGHRKARQLAQEHADAVGRKVYLQTLPNRARTGPRSFDRLEVVIADDGRGPFWPGAPWREYWPRA